MSDTKPEKKKKKKKSATTKNPKTLREKQQLKRATDLREDITVKFNHMLSKSKHVSGKVDYLCK